MNKKQAIPCTLLSAILFFNSCVFDLPSGSEAYSTLSSVVIVPSSEAHPANQRQYQATVWLGCYGTNLYFCDTMFNQSKSRPLYAVEAEAVTQIADLRDLSVDKWRINLVGQAGRYLYYWDLAEGVDAPDTLYCFDLAERTETALYTGGSSLTTTTYFAGDGSVYFPLRTKTDETPQFVHVLENEFIEVCQLTEAYPLGARTYHVVAGADAARILCENEDGTEEELPFGRALNRSLIPCGDKLLVLNESEQDLLYCIDESGTVTELFRVDCLSSDIAVNTHGTDVYLSLLRYEKYGEIGMKRYENDTMEGTYRISLKDYSVEKINDKIFDGIYSFDDTCFYCCDANGDVFRMDFDGDYMQLLQKE